MKTLKELIDKGAILVDAHDKYKVYDLNDVTYIVKEDKIIFQKLLNKSYKFFGAKK